MENPPLLDEIPGYKLALIRDVQLPCLIYLRVRDMNSMVILKYILGFAESHQEELMADLPNNIGTSCI